MVLDRGEEKKRHEAGYLTFFRTLLVIIPDLGTVVKVKVQEDAAIRHVIEGKEKCIVDASV